MGGDGSPGVARYRVRSQTARACRALRGLHTCRAAARVGLVRGEARVEKSGRRMQALSGGGGTPLAHSGFPSSTVS